MSRDREVEIESLRRENDQLRLEVLRRREAGRARALDDAPIASHEPERAAAQPATEPDVDRLADRLEDLINAMRVDLSTTLDTGARSVTGKLDDLNSAIREETLARDRELCLRLAQLSSEIQQLRDELAATRFQLGDTFREDNRLNSGASVPGIIIDQGEFRDHEGPRRWRAARRPWFYLPLIWGLILLVLVLVGLLVWW